MNQTSRYDELHDRYHSILTTKSGTRYEILAAVVFAALERDATVIHDLTVFGRDTSARHQIDVHIEKNGRPTRILVECKDFDVSGARVGIGVVRNFWGVVDDVHPDEAWVISCNGFTKDARLYAKGKGIRLATLRMFESADWENRVQTVVLHTQLACVHNERINLHVNMNDEDLQRLGLRSAVTEETDSSQIFDGVSVRSISQIARDLASREIATGTTEVEAEIAGETCWISGDGGERFPFVSIRLAMPVSWSARTDTISADLSAARLLLADSDGLDFVLWQDVLLGYTIDSGGIVHLANEAAQRRLTSSVTSPGTLRHKS